MMHAAPRWLLGIVLLTALLGRFTPRAAAATVTWNTTTGTWDTATGNWTGGFPVASLYADGDSSLFNSTSGGVISVQAGGVTPAATTVSATSGTYTFQSNAIHGGSLTKSGGGVLTLNHANEFSSVTHNGGTINAAAANALGAGPLVVNSNGLTLTANQTVASLAGSGNIVVGNGSTFIFGGDNSNSTYTGVMSNNGTANKVGTGILTLGAGGPAGSATPNSFNIAEGTVKLGRTFTTWSFTLAFNPGAAVNSTGATLDMNGFNLSTPSGGVRVNNATATASTWVINGNGGTLTTKSLGINSTSGTPTLTINGDVNFGTSGATGSIDPRNSSTLIVNGVISGTVGWGNTGNSTTSRLDGSTSNTISGLLTVSGGTFQLNKSNGAIAVPGDVLVNAGTLVLLQPNQIANTSTVTLGANGFVNFNHQNETIGAFNLSTTGSKNFSSNSTLTLTGTGTALVLNAAVNGSKTLDLNLALTGATGGNVEMTSSGVNNNELRIGGVAANSRTLHLGSVTRTFSVSDNASLAIEATITSTIQGTGGFVKDGAGVLRLSGANTFSGDTRVDAGTLLLNNNLALQNSVFDTSGGGTLSLTNTNAPQFGGLKGANSLALSSNVTSVTLNVASGKVLTLEGNLTGGTNAALVKNGLGTQILAGTNTYAGTTTVQAGTLRIDGSIAGGATQVNGGAILSGFGTLGGDLTIAASGVLAPRSQGGALSVLGDTRLFGDAVYAFAPSDLTATSGLQLDDGWILRLGNVAISTNAAPIVLFEFDADQGIDLTPVWDWNVISGDALLANLSIILGSGGSPNLLVLNNVFLVPEPNSLALAGLGVVLLPAAGRRRRGTARISSGR